MKRFVFVGVWVATFILLGSGAAVGSRAGRGRKQGRLRQHAGHPEGDARVRLG